MKRLNIKPKIAHIWKNKIFSYLDNNLFPTASNGSIYLVIWGEDRRREEQDRATGSMLNIDSSVFKLA